MNRIRFERKKLCGILILVMITLAGLSYAKNPVKKTEILVSAASSLQEAITALGTQFEARYPQFKIVYNFAATGVLQTQIEQGAPADIFAGASLKDLADLNEKGLLDKKSITTLCHNTMVLAVRNGLTIPENTDFSLMKAPVIQRIAIGNPAYVPAGQYAVSLLTHLKLMDEIQSKLIYASNVREALTWVETGEADAALIYATDAGFAKRTRVAAQTDPDGPLKISYGIALTKQGAAKSGARNLLHLITSGTGRKLFEDYGFLP